MLTLPAVLTVIARVQILKPDFSMIIVCSPIVNRKVDGVLPTNLPSTVISAPSGIDLMTMVEGSRAARGRLIRTAILLFDSTDEVRADLSNQL